MESGSEAWYGVSKTDPVIGQEIPNEGVTDDVPSQGTCRRAYYLDAIGVVATVARSHSRTALVSSTDRLS